MERLIFGLRAQTQIIRRFVIANVPFSPLLPFVSSTGLIASI